MTKSHLRLITLLATLCLAGLSGCTTAPKSAKDKKADADEWVTLPPATGSNVPRRVRRSELADQAPSNVVSVSGQALANKAQDESTGPAKSTGGN